MENYLTRKGLFTEEFKSEVVAGFNMALDAAIEIAERPHSRKAATRLTSC